MSYIISTSKNRKAFHAERPAVATDLRHALFLTIVAATAFALAALAGVSSPAAMQLNGEAGKSPRVLAYADPMPERFGLYEEEYAGNDGHELNDAWMGMTAVSSDGVVLGYVTDAFIDHDGSLIELVIAPSGERNAPSTPVYLPAQFARLGGEAVQITLDARAVAQLEPATDLAMLGE